MTTAYPLHWPPGWPRTKKPQKSRFGKYDSRHTIAKARDFLTGEIERLKGSHMVISTNIPVRKDGFPYSNAREPDDSGVAVYFMRGGEQKCIPCDRWNRVADNIWAIAKTIDALRGIDRWGAEHMVNAAFNGFKALPEPNAEPWFKVLGVRINATQDEIKSAYHKLAKEFHPDLGGDGDAFIRVQKAFEEAIGHNHS